MPCVSGSVQLGKWIFLDDVFVIDHQKVMPILSQGNENTEHSPAPLPKGMRPYRALVDTGATNTCISSKVAQELGLEPIGLGKMATASGNTDSPKYFFTIGLTIPRNLDSATQQAVGEVVTPFAPIEGWEFYTDETTKFDVLLGMDIIMRGSLKLDFDGHFSFCF